MTVRPLALVRCDALPEGGVGHLVRCLAVVEAAEAAGWRTALVGDLRAPIAQQLVERAGVEVIAGARAPMERLATDTGARVIHIDHYSAPGPVPGDPRAGDPVVSAVQDGRHGRRPAHVVLDASSTGSVTASVVESALVRLTGPGQALLRRAVLAAAERRRALAAPCPRVVVTAGGTDAAGILPPLTSIVAEAVATAGFPELPEVLVLDPTAGTRTATAGPPGVLRRPPGPDLIELAADSTLVVTAGGTTTGELAVIGVPMAVVQAVDNQQDTCERLVGAGAALGLGRGADLERDHDRLVADLRAVLADPERRDAFAEAAADQVDGAGAQRLVQAWGRVAADRAEAADRGWAVGVAQPDDSDLLLAWRNDERTRAQSLNQDRVDPVTHARWFTGVLADPDRLLLVVRKGADPVGTVRFDRLGQDGWEVSITVAPEARGRGAGRTVLLCGEEFLASRSDGTVRVTARIRAENTASDRLFTGCGYRRAAAPRGLAAGPGVLVVGKQLEP